MQSSVEQKNLQDKSAKTKPTSKSKQSKKEARKKFQEMAPVFRIKPLGTDSCMCKYLGNIENSEKLTDELIEFDKPADELYGKSTIKLYDIGKYEIMLKVCACNIIGNYVLKNKKIPAYYVTMVYVNQLVSGQLFTLFLYFTPDEKTQKELVLPKHYVNKLMYGSYTLELSADDGFLDFMTSKLTPTLSEKIMGAFVDEFEEADDDGREILDKLVSEQLESELNLYKNLFNVSGITKSPSRTFIIKTMENFMRDDKMKVLAEVALELREKERRERMCPDQSFEPPKRVLNLREFRDHPEKLEEYLDNLSDDSDESTDS
jgi:hypothetical protein